MLARAELQVLPKELFTAYLSSSLFGNDIDFISKTSLRRFIELNPGI